MRDLNPLQKQLLDDMLVRRPDLELCANALLALHQALVTTYDKGGKLLVCGNGGSAADAMHIAGELCKSFERKRPIPEPMAQRLRTLPFGDELSANLEAGVPVIALGCNVCLKTAVENDSPLRDAAFAQEAYVLLKPEDVLMAISTSGNATNCLMALSVAKAVGATTVALTGPQGGKMAAVAHITIKAPGDSTKVIQEAHQALYHTACALIEVHYFPEPR